MLVTVTIKMKHCRDTITLVHCKQQQGSPAAWHAKSLTSDPYIRGAVPTRISHLMGQGRTIRLGAKIYEEVGVDSQPSFLGVHIDLQHVGALLDKIITKELLVPSAEKRVGYIYPLAIQAQLNHLWPTSKSMTLIMQKNTVNQSNENSIISPYLLSQEAIRFIRIPKKVLQDPQWMPKHGEQVL